MTIESRNYAGGLFLTANFCTQDSSFWPNVNSKECFSGTAKEEIQPADAQFSYEACQHHSEQFEDTSHLAMDKSSPSHSCLDNAASETSPDENKDSFVSESSTTGVRLHVVSQKPGNVKGKSLPDN